MTAIDYDAKLAVWQERLAVAQKALAAAQAAQESGKDNMPVLGAGGGGSAKTLARVNRVHSSYARLGQRALEAEHRRDFCATKVRKYQRLIAERGRERLTRDDIVGAKFVKTSTGWRAVRRVNKVTVSVESGYSWADQIPFDKILDIRRETALAG